MEPSQYLRTCLQPTFPWCSPRGFSQAGLCSSPSPEIQTFSCPMLSPVLWHMILWPQCCQVYWRGIFGWLIDFYGLIDFSIEYEWFFKRHYCPLSIFHWSWPGDPLPVAVCDFVPINILQFQGLQLIPQMGILYISLTVSTVINKY